MSDIQFRRTAADILTRKSAPGRILVDSSGSYNSAWGQVHVIMRVGCGELRRKYVRGNP